MKGIWMWARPSFVNNRQDYILIKTIGYILHDYTVTAGKVF